MLLHYEAGQMAASDLRAIIPKLPFAFVGASTDGATVGKTGSENQEMFLCLEHARLIWIRSANSHTGPQLMLLHYEAGQMAASDLRAIIPKLPLAFVGASTEEHLVQLAA